MLSDRECDEMMHELMEEVARPGSKGGHINVIKKWITISEKREIEKKE